MKHAGLMTSLLAIGIKMHKSRLEGFIPGSIKLVKDLKSSSSLPNALLGINHWDKPNDLSGTGNTWREADFRISNQALPNTSGNTDATAASSLSSAWR